MWKELNEIKNNPYTGKPYDAIRKLKCNCLCHEPTSMMTPIIHFVACCDNGFITEYRECK